MKTVGMILVAILWVMVFSCPANILTVGPGKDFATIQEAIWASWDGDEIVVDEGSYGEFIYGNGLDITIRSTDPNDPLVVGNTKIIFTATFEMGETRNTRLAGFTFSGNDPCAPMIILRGSGPVIEKCQLTWTAIHALEGSAVEIADCTLNYTTVQAVDSYVEVTGCSFFGNNGVIKLQGAAGQIDHCIFDSCGGDYMGVIDVETSDTVIENNTMVRSSLPLVYISGTDSSALVRNNIFAYNNAVAISGVCDNRYNCFWYNAGGNFARGAHGKVGDFAADPKFVESSMFVVDLHLKSRMGHWTPGGWVVDPVYSPCIDTGDPSMGIGYELNPNGGRIDMGCYGGTAQASLSPHGNGPEPQYECQAPLPGDVNGDCRVDLIDLALMAAHWLECNRIPASECL